MCATSRAHHRRPGAAPARPAFLSCVLFFVVVLRVRRKKRGLPPEGEGPRLAERWVGRTLLAGLLVWSFAVVVVAFRGAWRTHGVATAADSITPGDQLQYLAWARESADHLLVSNLFDLKPSHRVFFHPLYSVSGLASRAGLDIRIALLLWKPVGVVALFFGYRAYARRFLGRSAALGAVAFALLVAPLGLALGNRGLIEGGTAVQATLLSLESFPLVYLQGFSHIAIAVGLTPVFLLALERAVDASKRSVGRSPQHSIAIASAIGFLVSWLHPWQGEVLLAVAGCMFLWRPDRQVLRRWALPLGATVTPIAYYLVLSRFSTPWEIAARTNAAEPFTALAIAIVVVPFAVAAGFGMRWPRDRQEVGLLAWPIAAIALHFVTPSVSYHLFEGITLPLIVLAARADWLLGRRRLRTALCVGLVLSLAGTSVYLSFVVDTYKGLRDPYYFVSSDERAALHWLETTPTPGGVLTTMPLGALIPVFTGRATWVGHPSWTPDFARRMDLAERLIQARLSRSQTDLILREARPAFVVAGCASPASLLTMMPPGTMARRFGCVTVYELSTG